MKTVKAEAASYMKERGITLDYLGLAGSLTFGDEHGNKVQEAIDDVFQAQTIKPYLDVLTTKAEITALTKWNGALPALPSFVIVPDSLMGKTIESVQKMFNDKEVVTTPK